jgi:hypothetical protein
MLALHGFLGRGRQLSSVDLMSVFAQLRAAGSPASCLAVTDNSAVFIPPSATWPQGRRLFIMSDQSEDSLLQNKGGNLLVHSDDGATYNFSLGLWTPNLSEAALALLTNGSVMAVMRHCTITPNSTLKHCITAGERDVDGSSPSLQSNGSNHFDPNFRLAVAWSHDGGETFGTVRVHPDLVTPMCQSDAVTTHEGTVLVSSPYSETTRANMTVLASDDMGLHFRRQLRVWTGGSGYSALVCGLSGPLQCGIMFDRMFAVNSQSHAGFSHITYVRFNPMTPPDDTNVWQTESAAP